MANEFGKHVRVDLTPLKRFMRDFNHGMSGNAPRNNPIDGFFRQLAARYFNFAQRRFRKFSRGGGDWPDLKESTKRRRRKARKGHKGSRKFTILWDRFGTIIKALQGGPGHFVRRIKNGIRVGISGGGNHPGTKDKPMTIGRLAQIHNEGLGNVPKRVIIPEQLDAATVAGIQRDIKRAIAALGRRHGRRRINIRR